MKVLDSSSFIIQDMLENESLESKRFINSIIEFEGQETIRRAIDYKNFQSQAKDGKEPR